MQAIQTKFIGPTNHRGSRVKAFSEAFPRGVTVGWDYGAGNDTGRSDVEANHDEAARAFIVSKGWHGVWARGATRDGYVYVCLSRRTAEIDAGRGILREGKRVLTIQRDVPKTGAPSITPTEVDAIARLYADLFYVQAADLLIQKEAKS